LSEQKKRRKSTIPKPQTLVVHEDYSKKKKKDAQAVRTRNEAKLKEKKIVKNKERSQGIWKWKFIPKKDYSANHNCGIKKLHV